MRKCSVSLLEYIPKLTVLQEEIIWQLLSMNGLKVRKFLSLFLWNYWSKWRRKLSIKNKHKTKLFFRQWFLKACLFWVVFWLINNKRIFYQFTLYFSMSDKILKNWNNFICWFFAFVFIHCHTNNIFISVNFSNTLNPSISPQNTL